MSESPKFEPSTYDRAKEQLKANGLQQDTPALDASIQDTKDVLGKKMATDSIKSIHDGAIMNRMEFKDNMMGNESFRNSIMEAWKNGPDMKIFEFLNLDFLADLYGANKDFINEATGYKDISATSMKLSNIDGKLQLLVQQTTPDGDMVSIYDVPVGRKIEAGDVLDISPGLI